MRARIYQRTKTAMQSGRAGSSAWVLEFPRFERAMPDRLTGWASSGDTMQSIRLSFATLKEAEAMAQANGIAYTITPTPSRKPRRRAYADNFAHNRRTPWTH